jgi:hypothetical protein
MRAFILAELEGVLEDTWKRLVVVELESADEAGGWEKRKNKVVAFAV